MPNLNVPQSGVRCIVTVDEDGKVTSVGGLATCSGIQETSIGQQIVDTGKLATGYGTIYCHRTYPLAEPGERLPGSRCSP